MVIISDNSRCAGVRVLRTFNSCQHSMEMPLCRLDQCNRIHTTDCSQAASPALHALQAKTRLPCPCIQRPQRDVSACTACTGAQMVTALSGIFERRNPKEADAQAMRAAVLIDEMTEDVVRSGSGSIVMEMRGGLRGLKLAQYACTQRVFPVPTTQMNARRSVSEELNSLPPVRAGLPLAIKSGAPSESCLLLGSCHGPP